MNTFYVCSGIIVPHNLMMFTDINTVEFSGSMEECEKFIESEKGLAHQEQWELYEEMYEPDPRDQSYVDDFGDPCS